MGKIASALSHISSTERETWLMCGMAIKQELGDAGFSLWDNWSQEAESYNAKNARAVWNSIRAVGKVTMGSLYHEAMSNGWRDNGKHERPTQEQIEERNRQAAERLTEEGKRKEAEHQAAAKKAAWIMHQAKPEKHAYLHKKGFKDTLGKVWWATEETNLLVIPMNVGDKLVGVQLIDRHGNKKFLKGQRTSGAYHLINNDGYGAENWFVEGYANALSLRECLKSMSKRYKIYVTFSAQNLKKVATMIGSGCVIADQDKSATGERIAEEIGFPYWIPFDDGTDFNDFYLKVGRVTATHEFRRWYEYMKKL
jgi:putative DNA primase/helicase